MHSLSPTDTFNPLWKYILNKPTPELIWFKVGDNHSTTPGNQVYINSKFIGRQLIVSRNGLTQWPADPGNDDSYYIHSDDRTIFYGELLSGDSILILII